MTDEKAGKDEQRNYAVEVYITEDGCVSGSVRVTVRCDAEQALGAMEWLAEGNSEDKPVAIWAGSTVVRIPAALASRSIIVFREIEE